MLGRRFTHLCNINLLAPRHPELINRDFKEFLKKLSKEGVSGHWTIEIDRSNIVHWHLLFQNYGGDEESLKATVTRCLKSVSTFPRFRVYADRIRNQRRKLEYVLKVKKTGYGEVFDPLKEENHGKISGPCHDIYARDRILFKPKTGLNKHGTFGDFWARNWNEKKIWSLICEETATVERNYAVPWIRSLVHSIHERLGIPLGRVKWAYCLNPPRRLPVEAASPSPSGNHRRRKTRSTGLVGILFRFPRKPVPFRNKSVAVGESAEGVASSQGRSAGPLPVSQLGAGTPEHRSSLSWGCDAGNRDCTLACARGRGLLARSECLIWRPPPGHSGHSGP